MGHFYMNILNIIGHDAKMTTLILIRLKYLIAKKRCQKEGCHFDIVTKIKKSHLLRGKFSNDISGFRSAFSRFRTNFFYQNRFFQSL